MITMTAYFGDSAKQAAVVAKIKSHQFADSNIGIVEMLGSNADSLSEIYELTGFPVSLISVIEHIFSALPRDEAFLFATQVFSSVSLDRDVADIGWQVVEHVLTSGIVRGGEKFLEATRQMPSLFPSLNLPKYTPSQLKKMAHRETRIARRIGQETSTPRDPRVSALMTACTKGSNDNAGKVICWAFSKAHDSDRAIDSARRQLLSLLTNS